MLNKVQSYTILSGDTARQITASREQWTDFLRLVGRLYKYPFAEQLLIYAQRPEAEACAEYDFWNSRMQRYVRRGSKGIALIDDSGSQPRLKYVFDVADTGGRRKPYLWQYDEQRHEQAVTAALEQEYGISAANGLAEQLRSIAEGMAEEYWLQNQEDILSEFIGSPLSRLSEEDIGASYIEAAEVSIAYTLLSRCGLNPNIYFEHEEFLSIFDFTTPASVAALGAAVSDCSEQVLRRIEVVVKNYERERIEQNERIDLSTSGRLSVAGIDYERAGFETTGQIRTAAEGWQYRPVLWTALSVSSRLNSHLLEIEETANRRLEQVMKALAEAAGITENLKAKNPLRWTGLMNSLHNQAEEIILREIVLA